VTGASSGFGRILTEYLLKQGDRVVATLRKPDELSDLVSRYPSTRLVVVKLDATHHAEISAAFAKAQEAFGRVDVVFNNAGKMINGELESVNDEHAREIFEINFWGAAQVSREAVRFFRDVNQPRGGRLLQVSSGLGIVGRAKFALEGLTEALVDELNPAWNIKITILEPGPFLTELATTNRIVVPPHPAYTDPEMQGSKWRMIFKSGVFTDGDPQKACVAFEKASRLEDPPIRLPLHRRALDVANEKGKGLIETAEKYKDWSDDLYL
ncbi:NAD(P)-binding protein, partial [Lanmaoa asiatica]